MKKAVSAILSLVFVVLLFPTQAFAESFGGSCGKNVSWSLDADTGVLTISGNGDMDDFSLGASPWLSHKNVITSVIIENGVTTIGDHAFNIFSNLISVTIPKSVTSISDSAFLGCKMLADISVEIENPKYSSMNGVLFNKDKTELIICPYGKQGDYSVPPSVTTIEDFAFSGCSSLTSVSIPDSVMRIGDNAFVGCSSLTSVIIPPSVTIIGDYTFFRCDGLTSVTIPESVTKIGDYSFCYCEGLTSVTIPENVTSIGDYSFGNCKSLTSVTIPENVATIGINAFLSCENLTLECYENSAAHNFALENDIPYTLIHNNHMNILAGLAILLIIIIAIAVITVIVVKKKKNHTVK